MPDDIFVLRYVNLILLSLSSFSHFFFFNDTATTEIYTLSLHDALPISCCTSRSSRSMAKARSALRSPSAPRQSARCRTRSEEHTSELQSHVNLVCRHLLEKKKKKSTNSLTNTRTPPRLS